MSLHNEIINTPANIILDGPDGVGNVSQNRYTAYKEGHRDARHAAAELALKYDVLVEKLLDALEARNADDYVDRIRKEYDL